MGFGSSDFPAFSWFLGFLILATRRFGVKIGENDQSPLPITVVSDPDTQMSRCGSGQVEMI
jgi:hypothetical protein